DVLQRPTGSARRTVCWEVGTGQVSGNVRRWSSASIPRHPCTRSPRAPQPQADTPTIAWAGRLGYIAAMRIRTLGRSGLRVSEICLGAMTFGMPGWGCDEATSLALVERFLEAGGNFVDTADAYAGTISEEICGKAMAGRRTQFVLATKCTMPTGSGP